MLYGLYQSANGAAAQSLRLDVIANNLANAETTGFKRDLPVLRANPTFDVDRGRTGRLPNHLDQHAGGVSLGSVETDFSNGALDPTGGMLDVAITGPGFLKVSDGRQQLLTRDGRLSITADGELVSRTTGDRVLNAEGATIRISRDATSINIGDDGTISEVDAAGRSVPVDRLAVVEPRDPASLSKLGQGRFIESEPSPFAGPATRIRQGHLETSGTNPLTSMVAMIEASRAFETNVNMIQHQDHALGRLLQAIPR